MQRTRFTKGFAMVSLLCVLSALTACGSNDTGKISSGREVARLPGVTSKAEVEKESERDGILSVVTDIDTDNKVITLRVIGERTVELTYTGACDIRDDVGEVISITQVPIGEVVDIAYTAGINKLTSMYISSNEWKKNVSGIDVDTGGSYIEYKGDRYTYDDNLIVVSNGNKVALDSIEQIDELILKGRDKKIDSIIVERGHGYLQLKDTNYYEGGIIEVGNEVITGIKSNMKLLVPEGEFRLTVTKGKESGSKIITIERNLEQVVSLAELQQDGQRYGNVGFDIKPEGASLYIDKVRIKDYSNMVEVTYGEHEIEVIAEGYKNYTRVVNIDSVYVPISVELIRTETEAESGVSESSENDNSSDTTSSDSENEITVSEQITKNSEKETTSATQVTTANLADIVSSILIQ